MTLLVSSKKKNNKIVDSFPDDDPTNTDTNGITEVPNLVSDISQFTNFREVTDEDIVKYIRRAPNKYCAQLDPLPTQLVKDNIDILAPKLTNFVNKSLRSGIYAKCL